MRHYPNIKLLYVEDDEIARENAVEFLEDYFDNIYEAKDGLEALGLYEKYKPDIIITDISMPKVDGLEFVSKIRQSDKKTNVIVTTAYNTKEYLFRAVELQLVKYLIKPVCEDELISAIEVCVENLGLENSNIIEIDENISFDIFNKSLIVNSELVKLRTKEILFLELLAKNRDRFVTYNEIENFVWAESVMSKDALKTLVKRVKTHIGSEAIKNLSGTGYKLECQK